MPTPFQPVNFSLRGVDEVLWTPPRLQSGLVTQIAFVNTSALAATVRIHRIGPNMTPGTSNALFYDYRIAAQTTVPFTNKWYLPPGWSITGRLASGSGVTVWVEGVT